MRMYLSSKLGTVGRILFQEATTKNPLILLGSCRQFSTPQSFECIKLEKRGKNDCVGIVTLHRPKVLNALSMTLLDEVNIAFQTLNKDPKVGAIVLTGSEKAFSSGVDIATVGMDKKEFADVYLNDFPEIWPTLKGLNKPVIAAVNGHAIGGGFEIAIMCDIVYAGENAKFCAVEVKVGTAPGCGGTQRLTRAVGKSLAMEMALTGDPIDAQTAYHFGLVSKIVAPEKLVDECVKLGERISERSPLIVAMCKNSVNMAFETTLEQGLNIERRTFHSTFATNDQKEGMAAFLARREPKYTAT